MLVFVVVRAGKVVLALLEETPFLTGGGLGTFFVVAALKESG